MVLPGEFEDASPGADDHHAYSEDIDDLEGLLGAGHSEDLIDQKGGKEAESELKKSKHDVEGRALGFVHIGLHAAASLITIYYKLFKSLFSVACRCSPKSVGAGFGVCQNVDVPH